MGSVDLSQGVRPLRPEDLDRTIAIDQAHTGRSRRRFFEKRLEAAKKHPKDFIHVGVSRNGVLAGFAFARVLHGEFGRSEDVVALDLIGVDPEMQERGYGHALLDALAKVMREKGIRVIHSQADWTNHGLLEFFDSSGFELAPRLVLERAVTAPLAEATDEI
jgi:ribosomal protein S18 acetylase RimI-like enzyme